MNPGNPSIIEPEAYPANNPKARMSPPRRGAEEESDDERLPSVVEGTVVQRDKPLGRKIRDFIFNKNVFAHVWGEIVKPSIRDTIFDAGQTAMEYSIYGDTRGGRRPRSGLGGAIMGNVAYHQMSSRGPANRPVDPRSRETAGPTPRAREVHDFREIIIPTRREANEVLAAMDTRIARYQVVTVADLYDLCNVDRNYTDRYWGWTNLQEAKIQSVGRDGFLLDLPRPEPLDG